jgi:hypothetical protein
VESRAGLEAVVTRTIPSPRRELNPDHPIVQPTSENMNTFRYFDRRYWAVFDPSQGLSLYLPSKAQHRNNADTRVYTTSWIQTHIPSVRAVAQYQIL